MGFCFATFMAAIVFHGRAESFQLVRRSLASPDGLGETREFWWAEGLRVCSPFPKVWLGEVFYAAPVWWACGASEEHLKNAGEGVCCYTKNPRTTE